MSGIELRNAVVVVAEALSDIGRAIAGAFAAQGAKLVLAGCDPHALRQLAAQCESLGAEAVVVEAGTDTAAIRRLVNAARERHSRIDIWVGRADETARADLRSVVPVFLKQKHGVFINLGADRISAALRAQLSARRDIHLCDLHASSTQSVDRIAATAVALARTPRPRIALGVNDDFVERARKSGTAFCMAVIGGLGGVTAALQAAKLG